MDAISLRLAVINEVRLSIYRGFKGVSLRELDADTWSIQVSARRKDPEGEPKKAFPQMSWRHGTSASYNDVASVHVYIHFSDEYVLIGDPVNLADVFTGKKTKDQCFMEKGGLSLFDPDFLDKLKAEIGRWVRQSQLQLRASVVGGIDYSDGDWRKQLRSKR